MLWHWRTNGCGLWLPKNKKGNIWHGRGKCFGLQPPAFPRSQYKVVFFIYRCAMAFGIIWSQFVPRSLFSSGVQASLIFFRTPSYISSGTPSLSSGTPSLSSGTPSLSSGIPSYISSGTPSLSLGTPSLSSGTPSLSSGTPSLSSGTPSLSSGTPSLSSIKI